MEIYGAVVMFLPCMQTSMSWEVALSPGILKSFLSQWVRLGILKIYISANCVVKHFLKAEISRIPLILIQHLKKLENCFHPFQNLIFKELSLSLWKSV